MSTKRKFIFDTDISPDCDDCGALAILDQYHKAGKIELLGVTHCTSDLYSIDVIAAIHDYFGVSTPIGQMEATDFLSGHTKYTKPVSEIYRKNHPAPQYESAIPLMRRLLAENRNVTLLFVGPLTNMRDLLVSSPDEFSSLSGEELVKQSVDQVIIMGGNFMNFRHAEFNIDCDIPAAQYTSEHCPVPIIYCGFEAGYYVMSGVPLADCDDDYPVKQAYGFYLDGKYKRNSWDLVTVLYAIIPENPKWVLSEECCIRFQDNAISVVSEGTGARYVRYQDERELETMLDDIIARFQLV